jgi:N-carbamoyl-L-amino-acid hydrolase
VLRVDAARLRADFEALSAIGGTEGGGVSRPSFSDAHLAAREWFLERGSVAGLEAKVDAAGNHSLLLRSGKPDAPTLLLGSHLDSVPNGGRFDGALGVVASLEVLRRLQDEALDLPVTLEAIDFTDEEGTLVGLLGSLALAGRLAPESLAFPRGGREALRAGLARAGLKETSLANARRDPSSLTGYLELHVEQGPMLERERVDVGLVTGIVGSRSFFLTFVGTASHAGTTPMDARRDAAVAAARFVVAARELVVQTYSGCVVTVGDITVEPGSFNVVPGRARVAVEFRSVDDTQLDRLETALLDLAKAQALEVEVEPVGRWEPTALDPTMRAALARAADRLGLSTMELASGAGHDAQALAAVTRSGMAFVPSRGGISHAPEERTAWEDCVNGADVLLGATLDLAGFSGLES